MGPRWAQNGPGWPKMDQDGPKMAPRWFKMPQDKLKMGPRWPKMSQDEPKMALTWPQDAPLWPQDGPRRAQHVPKMVPEWAQIESKIEIKVPACFCLMFDVLLTQKIKLKTEILLAKSKTRCLLLDAADMSKICIFPRENQYFSGLARFYHEKKY